ncbi:MAG: hypothetical protein K8I27_07645 [Planctomycetes bacterium]|nr:hypothetical protein [Planctomycetota bacterium]
MTDKTAGRIWRVSPLLKMRMMFGMPWVFGIVALFLGGLLVAIVKYLDQGRFGSFALLVTILAWLAALGLMAVGALVARRDIGILKHANVATGCIESITVHEFHSRPGSMQQPSEFYRFNMSLTDDAGNTWSASYDAGILGYDAQEGEYLDTLYDRRDRSRIIPIRYMHGQPTPGDDGVIRTGNPGEAWGYACVGIAMLAEWVVVLAW